MVFGENKSEDEEVLQMIRRVLVEKGTTSQYIYMFIHVLLFDNLTPVELNISLRASNVVRPPLGHTGARIWNVSGIDSLQFSSNAR
jgi:hypothetical protein